MWILTLLVKTHPLRIYTLDFNKGVTLHVIIRTIIIIIMQTMH